MSAPAEIARGRTPLRPGRNDLQAWRRLVRECRSAAQRLECDPTSQLSPALAVAGREAAARTAPGWGCHQSAMALARQAQALHSLHPASRPAEVRRMLRHADQVEAACAAFAARTRR